MTPRYGNTVLVNGLSRALRHQVRAYGAIRFALARYTFCIDARKMGSLDAAQRNPGRR